jgi:hypothetical protein
MGDVSIADLEVFLSFCCQAVKINDEKSNLLLCLPPFIALSNDRAILGLTMAQSNLKLITRKDSKKYNRGQCYDHQFQLSLPFFGGINGVFSLKPTLRSNVA